MLKKELVKKLFKNKWFWYIFGLVVTFPILAVHIIKEGL
jgi:hypothetical protein